MLNVKPGMTKTLSLLGDKFEDLSACERGGISVEMLFKSYKSGHTPDENSAQIHVEVYIFSNVAKLLSKRGKSKGWLSSY